MFDSHAHGHIEFLGEMAEIDSGLIAVRGMLTVEADEFVRVRLHGGGELIPCGTEIYPASYHRVPSTYFLLQTSVWHQFPRLQPWRRLGWVTPFDALPAFPS
jgi:hypothetical protein